APDTIWCVLTRTDSTDPSHGNDMHSPEMRNIHTQNSDDGACVIRQGVKAVEPAIANIESLVPQIGFPPCGEFALGSDLGIPQTVIGQALIAVGRSHDHG